MARVSRCVAAAVLCGAAAIRVAAAAGPPITVTWPPANRGAYASTVVGPQPAGGRLLQPLFNITQQASFACDFAGGAAILAMVNGTGPDGGGVARLIARLCPANDNGPYNITAYDAVTGEVVWVQHGSPVSSTTGPSVVVSGPNAALITIQQSTVLTATSLLDGSLLWTQNAGQSVPPYSISLAAASVAGGQVWLQYLPQNGQGLFTPSVWSAAAGGANIPASLSFGWPVGNLLVGSTPNGSISYGVYYGGDNSGVTNLLAITATSASNKANVWPSNPAFFAPDVGPAGVLVCVNGGNSEQISGLDPLTGGGLWNGPLAPVNATKKCTLYTAYSGASGSSLLFILATVITADGEPGVLLNAFALSATAPPVQAVVAPLVMPGYDLKSTAPLVVDGTGARVYANLRVTADNTYVVVYATVSEGQLVLGAGPLLTGLTTGANSVVPGPLPGQLSVVTGGLNVTVYA
jgi:hypothetical protein